MDAFRTIDSLYDRNIELVDRCERYQEEIQELTKLNEEILYSLHRNKEKADARIQLLEA